MRYKDNHGWQLYDYYQWLLEKVECPRSMDYSLLLRDLHSIVFEYHIERDGDRAANGVALRHLYMEEENISEMLYSDDRECSVLEMMIAMCESFAYDAVGLKYGPPSRWFWEMIDNLGLDVMTDDCYDFGYVEQQIRHMLDRTYRWDGKGGPFPLRHAKQDQRRVEIWRQMCLWFAERISSYGPFER